jgi:hypothetical protein
MAVPRLILLPEALLRLVDHTLPLLLALRALQRKQRMAPRRSGAWRYSTSQLTGGATRPVRIVAWRVLHTRGCALQARLHAVRTR